MATIKLGTTKVANRLMTYCEKRAVEKDGIDCDVNYAKSQFHVTRESFGKNDNIQAHHIIQSFAPGEIKPEQANKLGIELAQKLAKGHECVVYTHADKEHIHNHIVVNSVNYENGSKFQLHGKKAIEHTKSLSDEICKEYNLSIVQKQENCKEIRTYNINKYKAIEKGAEGKYNCYVLNTALDINKTKEIAKSKNEFVELMNKQGYDVSWKDNHKYITFTDKDGHKVRNSNIEKTYNIECGKEQLINEFTRNSEKARGQRERDNEINGAFERNNGTKRADEELHQSSYERGNSQRSNDKQGIAEDRGHEQSNSRENEFDFEQARRNVEELQRGTSRAYGEWQERDSNQQSKDTPTNEPNRADNEKQLSRDKGASSRGLERSRVADFEIDF